MWIFYSGRKAATQNYDNEFMIVMIVYDSYFFPRIKHKQSEPIRKMTENYSIQEYFEIDLE